MLNMDRHGCSGPEGRLRSIASSRVDRHIRHHLSHWKMEPRGLGDATLAIRRHNNRVSCLDKYIRSNSDEGTCGGKIYYHDQ